MAQPLIAQGMLQTQSVHEVYWEMAGNPDGVPAIVLHCGPGSGCREGHYDLFDLSRYKVILMDQRGCGRSRPRARESLAALKANTTDDLLSDISALRQQLGISNWLVFGGSWGSTLGLLYAQTMPQTVRALVLAGVATTSDHDLAWLYGDIGGFYPEALDDFCALVPHAATVPERIETYATLLQDGDTAQSAADAWCRWELAIFGQDLGEAGQPWADPGYRLGFARIVTHYFRNRAWRADGHILNQMHRIKDLPGVMIHSRFDPSCPLRAAWALAKRWPAARLEILGGNDHSALSSRMKMRIRAATDAYASEWCFG
ncbi:MAG: prolyl aminopeptidase [Pseudomonadota bacterium]